MPGKKACNKVNITHSKKFALELLHDGNSIDKVAKYTYLSLEEIKKLQEKIRN
jgi:hypothetical protein